jgi:hypothetical protein
MKDCRYENPPQSEPSKPDFDESNYDENADIDDSESRTRQRAPSSVHVCRQNKKHDRVSIELPY